MLRLPQAISEVALDSQQLTAASSDRLKVAARRNPGAHFNSFPCDAVSVAAQVVVNLPLANRSPARMAQRLVAERICPRKAAQMAVLCRL